MSDGTTIAAISTPLGEGGIGIVRLSGEDAIEIADRLFYSPKGKTVSQSKSHRVLYGFIKDPSTDRFADEVLLTVMRSPNSYTREDVVEINCHGGMLSLRKVLELVLEQGAVLAEPGEFTKRAFLSGRIDLSQAEAVLDLIRAKTDESRKVALEQIRGRLSQAINEISSKLTDICVHVEAYLDFPEDEIEPAAEEGITQNINVVMHKLNTLLRSYEEGRFFRDGLPAAIVGRPNVGKSSLLNALLQRDRAIVTEMPGTTRDVIEEYLNIDGLPLRIMDTAGIRESHDMVEQEGVKRSLKAIEDAGLVIAVIDGSAALRDEDFMVLEKLSSGTAIIAINKSDLPSYDGGLASKLASYASQVVGISAKRGSGLDMLKGTIKEVSLKDIKEPGEGLFLTNLRHKLALEAAAASLKRALEAIETKQPLEIAAFELREALDRIGDITGAVSREDILNRIFDNFCIGK